MARAAADEQLKRLLVKNEPFGPVDHAYFDDAESANTEICSFVPALRVPMEHQSSIIIGRKGSGKSTYLSTYHMDRDRLRARFKTEAKTTLPSTKNQIAIVLKTWSMFNEIVQHLKRVQRETGMEVNLIPPEQVEVYWREIIWDKIIEAVYEDILDHGFQQYPGIRAYFDPSVPKVVMAARSQSKNPQQLISAAVADTVKFFKDRKRRAVIILDNIEKYLLRTPEYQTALQGFVRAVAHFDRSIPNQANPMTIVLALPEEIEGAMSTSDAMYANILKDTARSSRIRWKTGHLWTVALHRYRLFLSLYDEVAHHRVEGFDLSKRDGRKGFLHELFPGEVTNGRGGREGPENYLIRHTQLLPRHVLTLLNGIVGDHVLETGDFLGVPVESVVAGVALKEEYLAKDVLTPYTWMYPTTVAALSPVMAELGHCFKYGELDKRLSRIALDAGADFDLQDRGQLWTLLYNMGVIGLQKREDDARAYVEGVFHFNAAEAGQNFVVNSQASYCFHPLFSRAFGVSGASTSKYCVFPAGIESLGADG